MINEIGGSNIPQMPHGSPKKAEHEHRIKDEFKSAGVEQNDPSKDLKNLASKMGKSSSGFEQGAMSIYPIASPVLKDPSKFNHIMPVENPYENDKSAKKSDDFQTMALYPIATPVDNRKNNTQI